jgi:hypothetical protein
LKSSSLSCLLIWTESSWGAESRLWALLQPVPCGGHLPDSRTCCLSSKFTLSLLTIWHKKSFETLCLSFLTYTRWTKIAPSCRSWATFAMLWADLILKAQRGIWVISSPFMPFFLAWLMYRRWKWGGCVSWGCAQMWCED